MRTLDRAVSKRGVGGHPLPSVFPVFDRHKISFRASEVAMIAGQPGAGKSLTALWLVTQWVSVYGLRGIYFSADSSELVQAGRALAMVSHGIDTERAEQMLEAGDEHSLNTLNRQLNGLGWCFDPDITYSSLEEEVLAFEEMWGAMPHFLVVDNLTDVDGQNEDEWGTARRVMKGLNGLARATGAHVLVLHHTSEDYKDDPCPPRKAIQGKVAAKQGLILTVGEGNGKVKPICCVKNRFGPADKFGHEAINLIFNQSNFHLGGS